MSALDNAQRRYDARTPDTTGERWMERRREELARDLTHISEWLTQSPLLAHSDTWKHVGSDGTTRVYPAVTTGAATLRALMTGTDAEILTAVCELRAYVENKMDEQVQEDWDDFVCAGGGL